MARWEPAKVGEYDQLLTEVGQQVDNLVSALRQQRQQKTEHQAMANMVVLFRTWDRAAVESSLAVALLKLANHESPNPG